MTTKISQWARENFCSYRKKQFSIVIGSPRAYLSRYRLRDHVGVQLQVHNLNFL